MKAVVDRIVQYANRYKLTNAETSEVLGTFDFDEVTGTVQQVGTEIDKELFDSIADDLAARVVSNGGELKDTVVTFTDTTGTAANVASGDKTSTLWGKVKNWFSRLKALAFKDKISNADVANDANIAQSKIDGLRTEQYGVQIGTAAVCSGAGAAVGSGASATTGGAVGYNASATSGGGAVGVNAKATNGGAVGSGASATNGGAVGSVASATSGGAVGNNASATTGGAVGNNASATSGGAVGNNAKATEDGAVQLGSGTNDNANTLQFRGYQIVDANGNIPAQRLSANSPVRSVNKKTGAVSLSAADVGAATSAQGTTADQAATDIANIKNGTTVVGAAETANRTGSIVIQNNADLNDCIANINEVQVYTCQTNGTAATLANCPVAVTFTLWATRAFRANDTDTRDIQFLIATNSQCYYRVRSGGTNWANWRTLVESNGSYPTLGAGYLQHQGISSVSSSTIGWYKVGTTSASKIVAGNGSVSVIFLVNGVYQIENTATPTRSGLLELDVTKFNGNFTAFTISVLGGALDPEQFFGVLENNVVTLYWRNVSTYGKVDFTILTQQDETLGNWADLFEFDTAFYGTSAPSGAVYAVNRNIARPLFIANQVQAKTPTINTDMALDGGVNPSGSMIGDEVIFYCSGGGNYTCTGKIKSISGTTPTVTITGVVEQQASGGEVTSSGGFQGGKGASAQNGGAVGSGASAAAGGAVGQNASAQTGGAVGYNASAQTGGGAVGVNTSATSGGAVGSGASATTGGAVGQTASATTGFAGGKSAKATEDGAVQLGSGTNDNANTLQFRGYQIVDANGNIPAQRLSANSPVRSVNGKTGAVSLSAADVGAATPAQVNSVSMVPYGGQATTLSALSSGGVYSISANGYLRIAYQTTAADNYIIMKQVNSSGASMWGALMNGQKSYGSGYPFIYMPVAAGDHIKVEFSSSVKIIQVQLIKVKGVQ